MHCQFSVARWKTSLYVAGCAFDHGFFALCAQCAATLMVIRRETNSWRWPIFTFAYMTGLAYLGQPDHVQFGHVDLGCVEDSSMWLDWQTFSALAIVLLAAGVLIRRGVRYARAKESSSCGGCPNKSAPPLMKTTPLGPDQRFFE